jgi:hypothetical protein
MRARRPNRGCSVFTRCHRSGLASEAAFVAGGAGRLVLSGEAKAVGISVPQALLLRADEVIR